MILDAQVPGTLIKRYDAMMVLEDDLVHKGGGNYSTKSSKQGRQKRARFVYKIVGEGFSRLINGGFVDHDRAGGVSGGDASLLLDIEDFPPAQPVQRFL